MVKLVYCPLITHAPSAPIVSGEQFLRGTPGGGVVILDHHTDGRLAQKTRTSGTATGAGRIKNTEETAPEQAREGRGFCGAPETRIKMWTHMSKVNSDAQTTSCCISITS